MCTNNCLNRERYDKVIAKKVVQFSLPHSVHGVCMLRECIYGDYAHEQHARRTLTLILTLTHTITAYSVSGNVLRVRILICVTRQKPCRKSLLEVEPTVELLSSVHLLLLKDAYHVSSLYVLNTPRKCKYSVLTKG